MGQMLGKRKYLTAQCNLRYCQGVPENMRGLIREIHDFKVHKDFQNRGQGTKLMNNLIHEADEHQKVLILLPDNEKLELWYSKFGFVRIQQNPVVLMMREPKGTRWHLKT